MTQTTRKIVLTAIKLTLCGATIAAIGWAFLTLNPEEQAVKESDADVWDLVNTKRTSTQKFVSALEALGHAPPRAYDYNGNTVYFSERTTEKPTEELLYEYQNEFVWQGVNEEPYTTFLGSKMLESEEAWQESRDDVRDRWLAGMSGQIVPISMDENQLEMGSTIIDGVPQTVEGVEKKFEKMADDGKIERFQDLFRGFRNIKAHKGIDGDKTHVTAVWSDDDLQIENHLNLPDHEKRGLTSAAPDANAPSCPGCERLTRFAGDSENAEDYVTNIFRSPQDRVSVSNFYKRALDNRGWKETDTSVITRKALQYTSFRDKVDKGFQMTKDGRMMSVTVGPADGGSLITTFESPVEEKPRD